MAETENIGGVSVSIFGDYSQLSKDFDAAVALAVKEGATLAEALNRAYSQVDVTPLTEAFVGVGGAATVAAQQLKLFDEAAHVDYADASGQLNLFATELERLGPAAGDAAANVSKLPPGIKQAGDQAQETTQQLSRLETQLLATFSVSAIVGLGGEALSSFGNFQKADIALTAITGDAEAAAKSIEGLKGIALDDALSFPSLLTANQRLTEFGIDAEQIPGALRAIADAAAAGNRDFDQVANSFERIVLSGTVMTRTLVSLGINMQDMADVMGVAVDQVAKTFKTLDESLRAQIMTEALSNLEGTAQKTAAGILGQWQILKTETLLVFKSIGEALEPMATSAMATLNQQILPFVQKLVDAYNSIGSGTGGIAALGAFSALVMAGKGSGTGSGEAPIGAPGSAGSAETSDQGSGEGAASVKTLVAQQVAATAAAAAYKQMAEDEAAFHNSVVGLWNSLPSTYDQYLGNLAEGGKSAKSLATSIEADLSRASTAMLGMKGAPLAAMQEWVDALANAQKVIQAWAASDAFYQAAAKVGLLTDKFPDQVKELGDMDAGLKEFFGTMRDGAANIPGALNKIDVAALATKLVEAQKQLDDSGKRLTDTFNKFYDQYEERTRKAIGITDDFKVKFGELGTINVELSDRLPDNILAAYRQAVALNDAFRTLHITADDTGQALTKALGAFNTIAGSGNTSLSEVEAAWSRVSGAVSKLAKTDLPAATAEYQRYIEALQRTNAPIGEILAAQEKELQVEIQLKELRGVDATAEIEHLTQLGYETRRLHDASAALGEVYVGLRKDFDNAFASLSHGLADAIVNGKNLGDVFINVGKQIATSILDTIIKGALVPLQDELNKTGGLFDTIAKQITGGIGKLTSGLGGSLGSLGSGEVAKEVSGLPGGVSQGAGAGSGEAGGGAGGLLGAANPIIGIVQAGITAIAGIVQGFQMAHLENLTGEIEVTTRKIFNVAGGNGPDSILGYTQSTWQTLERISGQLSNLHDDNVAIIAMLEAGSGGSGAGGGGSDTSGAFAGIMTMLQNLQDTTSTIIAGASGAVRSIGPIVTGYQTLTSGLGTTVGTIQAQMSQLAQSVSAIAAPGSVPGSPSSTFSPGNFSQAAPVSSTSGAAVFTPAAFDAAGFLQSTHSLGDDQRLMKQYLSNQGFAEPTGGWGAYFQALGIPKSHIPANLFDSSFTSPLNYSTVPNNPIATPSNLIPSTPTPSFNTFGGGGQGSIPITVNALDPSARGVVNGIIQGLREQGFKI